MTKSLTLIVVGLNPIFHYFILFYFDLWEIEISIVMNILGQFVAYIKQFSFKIYMLFSYLYPVRGLIGLKW